MDDSCIEELKELFTSFASFIFIAFFLLIFYSLNEYGIKITSEIIQSLGIGLGSFLAGYAATKGSIEWQRDNKIKRAEKYIEELKDKYPRRLLNEKKLRIVQKKGTDMVYLLDERDKTSRWFKDKGARKDLGFSQSDTSGEVSEEELTKEYSEEDPIVSKKDYMA